MEVARQSPTQQPEIWRPLSGMPDGGQDWLVPGHAELSEEWTAIRGSLKDRDEARAFLDKWLEERGRAFAIETGQFEGLYTLKAGIAEGLTADGRGVQCRSAARASGRTAQGRQRTFGLGGYPAVGLRKRGHGVRQPGGWPRRGGDPLAAMRLRSVPNFEAAGAAVIAIQAQA